MKKADATFVYLGVYATEGEAWVDYRAAKDLHALGDVGTYDMAVVTKADGKVHVHKEETAAKHGAWGGAAVGALVGLLFPPTIIVGAAVGAAVGGVSGHLWKGMSRADVKELGELIDERQAALIVIGEDLVAEALEKAGLKAAKHTLKQLDVSRKDIDQAIKEAAADVG
ncbi:MAG TPA: DUF1269 domain-containing protein [Acidimicrobiales bacterium]|nr:DUF1269 domain-containing protein [Acidimicrobiales bacterium]